MLLRNRPAAARILLLLALLFGAAAGLSHSAIADDPNILQEATLTQLIKVLDNTIKLNNEDLATIAEKIEGGEREAGKIKEYAVSCKRQEALLREKIVPEIGSAYFGVSNVRDRMAVLRQQWTIAVTLVETDEWQEKTIEELKKNDERWRANDEKYRAAIEKMARMAVDNLDEKELAELVKVFEDIAKNQKESNWELVQQLGPGLNLIRDVRAQGAPGKVAGDGVAGAWSTYEQLRQALLNKYWDILDYLDAKGRSGKALAAFKLGGHARFELALAGLKAAATEYDFKTKLDRFKAEYTRVTEQYYKLIDENCAYEKAEDFEEKAEEYHQFYDSAKDTLDKAIDAAVEYLAAAEKLFGEREDKVNDLTGNQADRERVKAAREDFTKHHTTFREDMFKLSKEFAQKKGFGEWSDEDVWDRPGAEAGFAALLNAKANLCFDVAQAIRKYDTDLRKWIIEFNDSVSLINTGALMVALAAGTAFTFGANWSIPAAIAAPAAIAKAISDAHLQVRFNPLTERAHKHGVVVEWKLLPTKWTQLDNLSSLIGNFGEVYFRPFFEGGQWLIKSVRGFKEKLKQLRADVKARKLLKAEDVVDAVNEAWDDANEGKANLTAIEFKSLAEVRSKTTGDTWENEVKASLTDARAKALELAGKCDPTVKASIEKYFDTAANAIDDGTDEADDQVDTMVVELEDELEEVNND